MVTTPPQLFKYHSRTTAHLATFLCFGLLSAAAIADTTLFSTPQSPTQYTSGGNTIVKIVGGSLETVLDSNQIDTGADVLRPLGVDGVDPTWDVVTADHDSKLIRVMLQASDGGVTYTNYDITAANSPTDLAVLDINEDGLPDIITCENGSIVVYLNTTVAGTVSFGSGVTYSAVGEQGQALTITKVAVADVDNDGRPDLIGVGTQISNVQNDPNPNRIQVAVFKNTTVAGTASFDSAAIYGAFGTAEFVLVGDLTRNALDSGNNAVLDNYPEIIVGSQNGDKTTNGSGSGSYTIFINKGDGTYGTDNDSDSTITPKKQTVFLHIHAMALGDLDGDGNRDLILEASNLVNGQTFSYIYPGLGTGTFDQSNSSFAFIGSNPNKLPFQGDIALADLNGDGTLDIAMTDPVNSGGIDVWTVDLDPTAQSIFNNANKVTVATGSGAQAIGLTDNNLDTKFDLFVANHDANNLTLLVNTTGGGTVTGRNIAFGDAVINSDGTFTIPVLRGPASTGQVLAFFSVDGTAQQFFPSLKTYDYTILQPSGDTQELTFADGVFEQNILIKPATTKGPQPTKSIVLTLLTPVGDSDIGDPSTVTINLIAGKPAILKTPSGLSVVPTNASKVSFHPSPIQLIGVTGSDWNFAVTEPVAAGATDESVTIQTADDPKNGPWADLTALQRSGSKWTGSVQQVPLSTELYFRAVARATGFTEVASTPSKPFGVIPGPELTLNFFADSQSDGAGRTVHEGEKITYHFTFVNVGDGSATNALVNFPIPPHTTYFSESNNNGTTHTLTKSGKITAGGWVFSSFPSHTTYHEDLTVTVDQAASFSTKDPTKGFGYIIEAANYTIAAPAQGVKAGVNLVTKYDTEILGPISVEVQASANSAKPGDVITYTIDAFNDSAVPLTNGVVQDHLPAGTVLETVYAPNSLSDANSSTQPLPNPGPLTNPQIIYIRNPSGPTIDLSTITDPVVLALAIGYTKAKPTQEFDFVALRAQTLTSLNKTGHGADIAQFDDAIMQLINAGVLIPTAVTWPIPSIAASGHVELKYQVRVVYDLLKVSQSNPDGVPTSIANSNYDFSIAADGKPISALYGKPAGVVTTSLQLTAPASLPVLVLSKSALGEQNLNNSSFTGNGFQEIAGLGRITTAVQHHGFDYELYYANTGTNPAHDIVIHEVIPAGAALRGFFSQSVNGGTPAGMNSGQITYYDSAGNLIPTSAVGTFDKVKSIDLRLSAVNNLTPLLPGNFGTIRYTIEPLAAPAAPGKPPVFIHSLGGFDASLKRSDPMQGAYILTPDLAITVPSSPDDLVVKVISDVSFDFRYTKAAYNAKPGDFVPFDFTMNQNGDSTAGNTTVNLVIPQGAILATGGHAPLFTDNSSGAITVNVDSTGRKATLGFGTIAGHVSHTFRIYLQVTSASNPNLDPVLKKKGRLYFDTDPTVTYTLVIPSGAMARPGQFATAAVTNQPVLTSVATTKQAVTVSDSAPPHLSISRSSPYTIIPEDTFSYVIAFANTGDLDASNVNVGMQIPFFTHFVSTSNGLLTLPNGSSSTPQANATAYTTTARSKAQAAATGPGPDIVTWHFGTLPAHASGTITLTVQAQTGFVNDCIRDHSLYINADNAPSALLAPNPIGTWVAGKDFDVSKWEVLGCFCEHLGIPINSTTSPALQAYVSTLTRNSKVRAIAGLDYLHLSGGAIIVPLGHDQIVAIISDNSEGLTAGPGSQIISRDGAGLIATGVASAITVTGVGQNCSALLDNAQNLVASHSANIVAAGGGNLIGQDGNGFVLLSNHEGGASLSISAQTAGIVAAGGGNLIANGFGLVTGAGLITNDGAGAIGTDAAALIGNDGAGIVSHDSTGLVVTSNGTLTSSNGGSLIGQDGNGLIGQDGNGLIGQDGNGFKGGPSN